MRKHHANEGAQFPTVPPWLERAIEQERREKIEGWKAKRDVRQRYLRDAENRLNGLIGISVRREENGQLLVTYRSRFSQSRRANLASTGRWHYKGSSAWYGPTTVSGFLEAFAPGANRPTDDFCLSRVRLEQIDRAAEREKAGLRAHGHAVWNERGPWGAPCEWGAQGTLGPETTLFAKQPNAQGQRKGSRRNASGRETHREKGEARAEEGEAAGTGGPEEQGERRGGERADRRPATEPPYSCGQRLAEGTTETPLAALSRPKPHPTSTAEKPRTGLAGRHGSDVGAERVDGEIASVRDDWL